MLDNLHLIARHFLFLFRSCHNIFSMPCAPAVFDPRLWYSPPPRNTEGHAENAHDTSLRIKRWINCVHFPSGSPDLQTAFSLADEDAWRARSMSVYWLW